MASKTVRDLLSTMGIEAKDPTSPYLDAKLVLTDPTQDERQYWELDAVVPDGLERVILHWGNEVNG